MFRKTVLYLAVLVGIGAVLLQVGPVRDTVGSFTEKTGLSALVNSWGATVRASLPGLNSGQHGETKKSDRLYSKEELSRYVGEADSPGLLLAIMGRVYDVQSGANYYGPGQGYGFFAGRDGTRAFVTGQFTEEGLVDDVEGLGNTEMLEIQKWIEFYDTSYTYKGKLIGNFYDEQGNPTDALMAANKGFKEAQNEKAAKEEHKRKFPPCNTSWNKANGAWVSCTEKSGGITRDWVGVPRKYYSPGDTKPKCVCVRTTGPPYDDPSSDKNRGELDNPNIKEYEACAPTATACQDS